ncbi:MAG: flagellar biosynthetic protein FliR [Planctomycetota bacterium]
MNLLPFVVAPLLVFVRVMAFLFALPIFGFGMMPSRMHLVLAAGLTVALSPPLFATAAHGVMISSSAALLGAIAVELLLGSLIGFVVGLVFAGANMAGTIVGNEMGFMLASTIDPETGTSTPLMAHLYELVTMLVFLGLNGHYLALRLLARSLETVPPGSSAAGVLLSGGGLVALIGLVFEGALRMAAPLFGVLLLITVGLALLAKAVPQFNILDIGFPTRILVGLAGAGILLPATIKGFMHLCAVIEGGSTEMVEGW